MNGGYRSTIVVFERKDNIVRPMRITKSWHGEVFATDAIHTIAWREVFTPIDAGLEHPSIKVVPPTRADLIARGFIKEAGYSLPCLTFLP